MCAAVLVVHKIKEIGEVPNAADRSRQISRAVGRSSDACDLHVILPRDDLDLVAVGVLRERVVVVTRLRVAVVLGLAFEDGLPRVL